MAKETKSKKENNRHFFKDFKAELKKVIWPTPKQLVNNTIAVITIVLITAIIVFALDFAFESLNKYGVDKIKEAIQSIESTTDENNTNSNEANENATTDNTTGENTDNQTTSEEGTTEENSTSENSEEQSSDEATNEAQDSSENSVE